VLETTLAEIEVFEGEVLGDVGPGDSGPAEEVAVDVELECVCGHVVRYRRQTTA